MREVLKEMEKSPFMTTRAEGKKMRQTLERWRDILQPITCDGNGLDFDAAPHTLRQEIEEVLRNE